MNKYLLSRFVNETHPTTSVIDYVIRMNHHYLLLINQERNARVLLAAENYAGIEEDNGVYYIHSKKPIEIQKVITFKIGDDQMTTYANPYSPALIDTFEINIDEGDDIIGFHTTEEALNYCDKHSINTAKVLTSKLIFSPQLANFLLDLGFKIIHLKQHNTNGQTVFVFAVEKGFYEAIQEYRNQGEI